MSGAASMVGCAQIFIFFLTIDLIQIWLINEKNGKNGSNIRAETINWLQKNMQLQFSWIEAVLP